MRDQFSIGWVIIPEEVVLEHEGTNVLLNLTKTPDRGRERLKDAVDINHLGKEASQ